MSFLRSRMDWHFPSFSCEHITHARHQDKHCMCMWAQEWHGDPNGQAQIWRLPLLVERGLFQCLEDVNTNVKSRKEKWVVYNRRWACKRNWKEMTEGVGKLDDAAPRDHRNESVFNTDRVVPWVSAGKGCCMVWNRIGMGRYGGWAWQLLCFILFKYDYG